MKRLLLAVFALVIAATASAQYVSSTPSQIEARGSRIFSNGEKLTVNQAVALFSDFAGQDRGKEYLRNRAGYKTGVGLSVGGAALFAIGAPSAVIATAFAIGHGVSAGFSGKEVPTEVEVAICGTYGATLAGALIMLAGIPTASVYQHRIKKMSEDYNALGQKQEPVVSFRPASSGLGVAMVF
jgi:hypothetical protein